MKKHVHIIVFVFVLLIAGCSPNSSPQNSDLDEKIRRVENGLLFTETITARMNYHKVPGVSIAVINDYQVEWAKGYGILELGRSERVTADTLFQAASNSKPVTAATALYFVEQGLLDLDENVNDQLESWIIPGNEFTEQSDVTLRRLLSHTAGINQGLNRGYAPGEEVPTMLQSLEGEAPANSLPVRVDRVPGSENYYSNGGYLVVAQLLEDAAGKPFTAVMGETLFIPLGMTSSTFEQILPAELETRAASPHGWDIIEWKSSPGLVGKAHIQDPGYSGLWTTAPDLALFGAEVMRAYTGESDRFLSQETARLMFTAVGDPIPLQEPFDAHQALGFSLIQIGAETYMIHFGGSFPGYISAILLQPDRGFGIVILTNAWTGYELIWEIFYSVFYAYRKLPSSGELAKSIYSVLLFLTTLVSWSTIAWQFRGQKLQNSIGATIATTALLLTVTAILVLTLLYRGPLGGYLVPDRAMGEPVWVKALLGLFFTSPIILVILTGMVWKRRYWTVKIRYLYALIVLGALIGVFLLRDLWGLMFWG